MNNFRNLPYRKILGGVKYFISFENGYCVSIIRHHFSYGGTDGLWEMLLYKKGIQLDTIGHLTEDKVNRILDIIESININSEDEIMKELDSYDPFEIVEYIERII